MELFISGTANPYGHHPSWCLLVVLNEKPSQALWQREIHQPYKTNNATRYLLPNSQATALWGPLCILLVTCLFCILLGWLVWGEKRLVPTPKKKWIGPHQKAHFHQGDRHLSLMEEGTTIFLSQFTVYLITKFRYCRQLVSEAETGKRPVGFVTSPAPESMKIALIMEKFWWHHLQCLGLFLVCLLPAQTGLSDRPGYRPSKVWFNSLGMNKRPSPSTNYMLSASWMRRLIWSSLEEQEK